MTALTASRAVILAIVVLVVPFSISAKSIAPTVSVLNVRSAPSLTARVLDRARIDRVFFVIEERPQWYKVSWIPNKDGKTRIGWLMRRYVKEIVDPVSSPVRKDATTTPPIVAPVIPVVCPTDSMLCDGQCWSNCPSNTVLSCAGGIRSCNYVARPQILPAAPTETWEQIESRDVLHANTKGWSALISTNSFGEKRYYRKEAGVWIRKNSEAEIQKPYVELPTINQLANLRKICSADTALDAMICRKADFWDGYFSNLSFRRAMDDLVGQAQVILTENQRRKSAQEETTYRCLAEVTPIELRGLSYERQKYLREQKCGTATPASELGYKLYQQQQYQECITDYLRKTTRTSYGIYGDPSLSCSSLKPIFY